jgi:hypothetical protein
VTYDKQSLDSIQINGFAQLKETHITKSLKVNGNLIAEKSQIQQMEVRGQATLTHCMVKGEAFVAGTLKAASTMFDGPVILMSNDAVFDACSLRSILVRKTEDKAAQIIELKGKTKISGKITFESGNGEVIVDPKTAITEQQIIGGKIKKG